ncbi:MAG: PEGA domain-containing protein [Methanomicrobiales archaeon]|nr:PEGA domain-containing protein [Methanomicrobiales archaeon]
MPSTIQQNKTGNIEIFGTHEILVTIEDITKKEIPLSGTLMISKIPSGLYNLSAEKEGYPIEKQRVVVYADNTTIVHLDDLIQYGSLLITSEPIGVEAYLNGIRVGNTPVDARKMEVGDYFIKLQSDGYYNWEKTCTIEWNNHTEVSAKMVPKNGISLTPTPVQKTPNFTFIFTIISLVCMIFFIRRKFDHEI